MIKVVTGSALTITLDAANSTFANAFYGVDATNTPIPVPNSGPGVSSITVTVLPGNHALTMNFVSPIAKDMAYLYQGNALDPDKVITGFYVLNGTATYAPAVAGSTAPAHAAATPAAKKP